MATASGRSATVVTGLEPVALLGTASSGAAGQTVRPPQWTSVEKRLFEEPFTFDFFQAVRLLQLRDPSRGEPVGHRSHPRREAARFRSHLSLSFPPSAIYDLLPPTDDLPQPAMIVAFMGLTGPSCALPRSYTELLLRQIRDVRGPERYALRDWLDLFNHRMISLFYRAWEKYRFFVPYERRQFELREPDSFARALYSLIGLGSPPLRNRLRVSLWQQGEEHLEQRDLTRIDDLALLHFSGFLARRTRCAVSLEAMLQEYFGIDVEVTQFAGQWLQLEPANQSRMGELGGNCELGVNLVAGDRVWDVQGKFRLSLGPLSYAQFAEFIPDRSPVADRKTFFLLAHMVRLYVGPDLDFDVQLVLKAEDIPACRLIDSASFSPRLGWNTWSSSMGRLDNATDAVFDGSEVRWTNAEDTVFEGAEVRWLNAI